MRTSPNRSVLIIAFSYPPKQGIGSIRPGGLAKYLPQFGWKPIVVTSQLPPGPRPPGRIVEAPFQSYRPYWMAKFGLVDGINVTQQLERLPLPMKSMPHLKPVVQRSLRWIRSSTTYPDAFNSWRAAADKAVLEISRTTAVDAIVSTGPPASCHLVARKAKSILRRPWIADVRDPWCDHPYSGHGVVRRFLDERLELRTLRDADVLVSVSPDWVTPLGQRHHPKPCHWIPNGFDPDDFPAGPIAPSAKFSITHTGTYFGGRRSPALLFKVLRELISNGVICRDKLAVHFYGPREHWLSEMVKDHDLTHVVRLHGVVPRDAALAAQRSAQLLLLLRCEDAADSGFIPGKLFEYMASRRPIIALGGPPGAAPDLLAETSSGIHVTTEAQLKDYLTLSYTTFEGSGMLAPRGNEVAINQYSHVEMARRFADLLDTCCPSRGVQP